MSKAFTGEQDVPDAPQRPMPEGRRPITARGMAGLQRALRHILDTERPPLLAAAQDDAAVRAQLRALNLRAQGLAALMTLCDVAPAAAASPPVVALGTQVVVRDEEGKQTVYTVVGPDESNIASGCISYASPVGRALMGLGVGAWAVIERPKSTREVEVMAIAPMA